MYRTLFIITLITFGLNACTQWHRDSLRYGKTVRGTETYQITTEQSADQTPKKHDSLSAAIERNSKEIELYERHVNATSGSALPLGNVFFQIQDALDDLSKKDKKNTYKKDLEFLNEYLDIAKKAYASSDIGNQTKAASDLLSVIAKVDAKAKETAERLNVAYDSPLSAESDGYQPEIASTLEKTTISANKIVPSTRSSLNTIWPIGELKLESTLSTITEDFDPTTEKLKKRTTKQANDQLIRALSSSASMAQMRDLLTEPAFPSLLPTKREVELGCLPPPESAVFEASTQLQAAVNRFDRTTGNSTRADSISASFGESVVKMFEESERTLFLQYALFRLCEMSINAPSGFRNVYPVVIHDIVRRTAEMTELANKEAEVRRTEEAKTLKAKFEKEAKDIEKAIETSKQATEAAKQKTLQVQTSAEVAKQATLKATQQTLYNTKVAECIEKKLNADSPADAQKDCEAAYAAIKPTEA